MVKVEVPCWALILHRTVYTRKITEALAELVAECRSCLPVNQDLLDYYLLLQNWHAKHNLAIAGVKDIDQLIESCDSFFVSHPRVKALATTRKSRIYGLFEEFFEDFKSRKGCWNSTRYIKALHFTVCPYCNAVSIQRVRRNPSLDHFYPKSDYPMLYVSLRNLLPACEDCNGFQNKGDVLLRYYSYANPFDDDLHKEVRFEVDLPKLEKWLGPGIQIAKREGVARAGAAKAFLDALHVVDFYRFKHREEVSHIIRQARTYTKRYRRANMKLLRSKQVYENPLYYNGRTIDRRHIRTIPLAKFRLDMYEEYLKKAKNKGGFVLSLKRFMDRLVQMVKQKVGMLHAYSP